MSPMKLALLAATLGASVAFAHDFQLQSLLVSNPFSRATPPGARIAGAFMSIENQGKDADRLVSAKSPAAGMVEIHEMTMDAGVMRMRAVNGIDLKPGATLALKPGGYHMMLEDLKKPLKEGDEIPVTLTFEKAGSIDILVKVEAMGASRHSH